jgi:hypothetical protein
LTALNAEKARLKTSTSGKSFGTISEIHYTHYVFFSLLLSMFLLMVQIFFVLLIRYSPLPITMTTGKAKFILNALFLQCFFLRCLWPYSIEFIFSLLWILSLLFIVPSVAVDFDSAEGKHMLEILKSSFKEIVHQEVK